MTVVTSAYLDGFGTLKDGSVKVVLVSQEVDEKTAASLFSLRNKLLKVALSDDNISEAALSAIEQTEITDTGKKVKSRSQRLRASLYRLWESNNCGFEDFERFYDARMEAIIEQVKGRIA